MQSQVILREVTGTAAHFAELHQRAGFHRDARADRGLVAFCSDQLKQYAVIRAAVDSSGAMAARLR